jgi:ATP-dependent Clp protease ATP-binding subunit ClpC
MFDDEDALVRVDMSEYREQHTVSRLFGAPPGYVGYEEGGQLTEAVRRRPYQVVLFDEIEKAHPDVFNAMLQILDDGRLTAGQGRVVIPQHRVIMTNNPAQSLVARAGHWAAPRFTIKAAEREIEDKLKQTAEFLNRVDEIIIFGTLSVEDVERSSICK